MTTEAARREIKNFTAERNGTNDARQAGAMDRGELPELTAAIKARAIELYAAGYIEEAKAMAARLGK